MELTILPHAIKPGNIGVGRYETEAAKEIISRSIPDPSTTIERDIRSLDIDSLACDCRTREAQKMWNTSIELNVKRLHFLNTQPGIPQGFWYGEQLHQNLSAPRQYSPPDRKDVREDENRREVRKTPEDARMRDIEFRIANYLKAKGFPVPEVKIGEDGNLVFEQITGQTGETELRECLEYQFDMFRAAGESEKRFFILLYTISDLGVQADYHTARALSEDDKKYLLGRKARELAGKIQKSEAEVSQRLQTYSTMDALNIRDERFAGLFGPLEDIITESTNTFGQWMLAAAPRNTIVTKTGVSLIDFDHAEFAPSFKSAFYVLDAYLPEKGFVRLNSSSSPLTEEFKQELLQYWFKNSQAGKEDASIHDYLKGYYALRIPWAARQIDGALGKAKAAKDFESYYDAVMEADHFEKIMLSSFGKLKKIAACSSDRALGSQLAELEEYLTPKIEEQIEQHVDHEKLSNSIAWMMLRD